jgi:hypothetical protein
LICWRWSPRASEPTTSDATHPTRTANSKSVKMSVRRSRTDRSP